MELYTHEFTDEKGRIVRQIVDGDGLILDKLMLKTTERWIREEDTYKGKEEEFGQERSLGRNPDHIKLYRTNIQYILSKKKLSKDARCAFLSCIAYLDWNSNFVVHPKTGVPLSGREIAELTHLEKNAMNNGLTELQSLGVVAVMSSGIVGKAHHYVVNPSVAWKGKRIAKDIAQVKHFQDNGLKLPVTVKYSEGIKVR